MKEILFFRRADGTSPVEEFIDSLNDKQEMSDLKKYIAKRKAANPGFAEDFDDGYENFRIGVILKQARLEAGLTQDEIAHAIGTRKTAISRLENHVQDVKLSTVEKYAKALGRRVEIKLA